jgi:hypothetical protein
MGFGGSHQQHVEDHTMGYCAVAEHCQLQGHTTYDVDTGVEGSR